MLVIIIFCNGIQAVILVSISAFYNSFHEVSCIIFTAWKYFRLGVYHYFINSVMNLTNSYQKYALHCIG